ncbi:MAG: fused MFS/spermidine synthase [Planctomycetota bacterium]|jgi:hypothetical protein
MATYDKAGKAAAPRPIDERIEAVALYAVVFICGAVLMSAEIVGSRVLAPYFGSAIFVWGSLIGVVMLALAVGYYVGGRLADRYPAFPVLCGIVAAAGLFLLIMPAFSNAVCGAIEVTFTGPRSGPLLASVVLYLVPGVLLAMVSPFAVRLSARDLSSLGNVTGRLYALSTGGSIVGTLGTAFVLLACEVPGTEIRGGNNRHRRDRRPRDRAERPRRTAQLPLGTQGEHAPRAPRMDRLLLSPDHRDRAAGLQRTRPPDERGGEDPDPARPQVQRSHPERDLHRRPDRRRRQGQ